MLPQPGNGNPLSSCTKEAGSAADNSSRILTASLSDLDVKSTLENDGVTSTWAVGDVVRLTDGTNTQDFTLVSGTPGANQAEIKDNGTFFTVNIPAGWGNTIYGCYPSSAFKEISGDNVAITIPSIQNGSFASANICTGSTTGSIIEFKNATALMKITPDSETKTINIAISGGTPSKIVLATSSTDAKYVAVPFGGKFSDFTFTVVKNNGSQAQRTSTQSTAIERNTIYEMGAVSSSDWGLTYSIVHTYVDLGLSVKWATCNMGATSSEQYGSYFTWGEIETKSKYAWSTYKWCNGSSTSLTKYCTNSQYGTVDNKTTLDLEDDAAYMNWGGSWRMPTWAELNELWNGCNWTWTTQNNVAGYRATSKTNGKSIFLPAAGVMSDNTLQYNGGNGYCPSSSLRGNTNASGLGFYNGSLYQCNIDFCNGYPVRPVCQ